MGQRDSRGHEARGQEDAGDRLWSLPETGQSCDLPTHTHSGSTLCPNALLCFEDLLGPQRVMTPRGAEDPGCSPSAKPSQDHGRGPKQEQPAGQIHTVSSAPAELLLVPSIGIKDRSCGLRAQRSTGDISLCEKAGGAL